MKIFELLSGETATPESPTSAATAPMAGMQTPMMDTPTMGTPSAPGASAGTPAAPGAPMKTAGIGDAITNFFTTPQPIGGTSAPTPPAPATAPGQPPAQTSSSLFPRMFGNTAVGKTLDAVNGGLQGNPPKPQ